MENDEWETPQWLFYELNEEFNFSYDVACNHKNHKTNWYSKDTQNSLEISWVPMKCVYMNPPYSRGQLYKWCKKAYEESQKGVTVVGLLPVDTSTKWFHEWIWNKRIDIDYPWDENDYESYSHTEELVEVRFLPKRLKFEFDGIPQGTARFASMIVIWRGVNK